MSRPAADRAYHHTKRLILSGTYAGGQLMSEGEVAQDLGISRTPVHEAFLRLDAERLLALSSRRGAAVVPIAPDEAATSWRCGRRSRSPRRGVRWRTVP